MKCIIKAGAPKTGCGLSKKLLARTGNNNLLPHKPQLKCLLLSLAVTRSLCAFMYLFLFEAIVMGGARTEHLHY